MSLAPDPADKLDAAADGQFQPVNRRAGYGDQLERILRFAKNGACLSAGEGAQLVAHYEGLIEAAYREGWKTGTWSADDPAELNESAEGSDWKYSKAKASL